MCVIFKKSAPKGCYEMCVHSATGREAYCYKKCTLCLKEKTKEQKQACLKSACNVAEKAKIKIKGCAKKKVCAMFKKVQKRQGLCAECEYRVSNRKQHNKNRLFYKM